MVCLFILQKNIVGKNKISIKNFCGKKFNVKDTDLLATLHQHLLQYAYFFWTLGAGFKNFLYICWLLCITAHPFFLVIHDHPLWRKNAYTHTHTCIEREILENNLNKFGLLVLYMDEYSLIHTFFWAHKTQSGYIF